MTFLDKSKAVLVTQDNQLIEACYSMTLNEKRLLLLSISKINPMEFPDSNEPFHVEINSSEWNRHFKYKNSYRILQRAARSLRGRYVRFHPKTGITKEVNWFESVEYIDDFGVVKMVFTREMQIRLAGMLEQFTKIDIRSINDLTSLHSIRLYELLHQFVSTGNRTIEIDDFRHAMDCIDSYKNTGDLKKCVLKAAIKEINNKSDINVEFTDIKKGRLITHFRFVFSKKVTG